MKRSFMLGFFLVVAIVIALGHTGLHVYVWGTGIPGFKATGVSGLSVGNFAIGEESTGTFSLGVSLSQIMVVAEWVVVLFILIFSYTRGRIYFNRELRSLKASRGKAKGVHDTELDELYAMLKENKRIGFSAIARVFEIDDDVVADWADTLEGGKLASVAYPRFGDPELVLTEEKHG